MDKLAVLIFHHVSFKCVHVITVYRKVIYKKKSLQEHSKHEFNGGYFTYHETKRKRGRERGRGVALIGNQ